MATPTDDLSIRCPAKLNLTLAVGPARDDGLHPIASVMAALGFGDDLHLRRPDNGPSTFDRRFAEDAPKPQAIDWPIESDLAYRAHAKLEQSAGRPLPIEASIDKRIPAGAGLGGGSSNAAGMLVGLRELFDLPMDDDALIAIGNELGTDVVFAIHALLGQRAALVTGIGDIIEPLDQLPQFHAVLIFPEGQCPTGEVYSAYDQATAGTINPIPEELVGAWATADELPAPHNDLTQAAIQVCPPISDAIDAANALQIVPRLTGSGSALFALVETQAEALAIAEDLGKKGFPACATGN